MFELKKGLSEGYLKQLINIEDYIVKKNIEAQIAHRFPNYTLHDMNHYKQVARNIGSLCEKISLTEEERFCLLAASLTHDLGMSLSESALVEYYENRSQARRKHAERSALMVTNELADDITNDDMREVIATICEGHGRDDLDSSDFDSQYKVNVRLMTCLLMFADSLDLRSGRRMPKGIKTDEQLMGYVFLSEDKTHDARIDKKTELIHLSRLHWLRHYYSTIPSIAQRPSPFPSVDIIFRGTVGVEKTEDGKPIYTDKNKYLPDKRLALIEEIILSDPLETHELIKPYISDYLKINIKNISSPDSPVLKVRYDPSKILFPSALVKTAYSAGLIRSREIPLKDNNSYRKFRIEPFFCKNELQVSISWKIGTLVPASVSAKDSSIDRRHFKWVQAAARETWDIVLWRVDRYLHFIIDKLTKTKPELSEVSERIESLVLAPQKILNGELKKVYLYHRESDYPYTTTRYISKHAIYDAKNGKISKNHLFGKVQICEREQKNGFLGLCKKIADNLNFSCEEKDAPEFVKLLRNKRIGFLLSSKTIIELLQQLKLKVNDISRFSDLEKQINTSIELLENALPVVFLEQRDVLKYMLQYRLMTKDDVDKVMAIENEIFDYPWKDKDRFFDYLSRSNAYIILSENKLIGYFLFDENEKDKIIILTKMAIKEKYKRQRFGSFIIFSLLAIVNKTNFEKVLLHVRESNTDAINFYKNLGFETISVRPGYYKRTSKEAAIEMSKYIIENRS